jgi:TatD DNase family protein
MNELFDSHCHIHWPDYKITQNIALANARDASVNSVICVGTDYLDSQIAVEFAKINQNVWASVGLHPHDAKLGLKEVQNLKSLIGSEKVVAIGECGLDYYYNKSPKNDQLKILRQQIELALENNLPIIFHVREAFKDLWPVFDDYQDIKGVFHSFTASQRELDQILDRGLYVGLNGIVTFSKIDSQLNAAKAVPLDRLLLETDAPFLSPVPKRGQTNEPANVKYIAQFLSDLRGESIELLSDATTKNTKKLFAV